MKKLFISALALAAFTACSQEEIVEQQASTAIAFEQAFVDNATRAAADPSITTSTITAFDVWGFMNGVNGVVFDQQRVTGSKTDGWSYSPLQYWVPGNDYYFGALAPVNGNWELDDTNATTDGIGTVSFTNVNGTEDLLYAATKMSTKENANPGKVGLTFNHLLSKVKFTFTNGFDAPNYSITVSDIKMTVPAEGKINLAQADWWSTNKWELVGTNTTVLEFGDMDATGVLVTKGAECQYERLTIPTSADQEYVVTFDVALYVGSQLAYSNSLSTTIKNAALEIGKAYNFHATLDHTNIAGGELKPIEFEVFEVKDWVDNNVDGGVIKTEVVGVGSVEEFEAAIAGNATNFKLTKAIEITGPLKFGEPASRNASAKQYTLDLNGKTITNKTDSKEYGVGEAIIAYSNLTINGEGTVMGSTRAVWARGNDNVVVTINGGTYKGAKEGFANGGCSVIYASGGNTINIYGGTFKALSADLSSYADKTNGVYAALNVYDNNGTINVYGGSFFKQNPAAPGTEPAAWNAAHANGFVAKGYTSKENGDWFTVVPATPAVTVTTADELFKAVNAGADITLGADITVSSTLIVEAGKVVNLNLNGKTLKNKVDNAATDVIIVKGNLTIDGEGTIEAVTGNDGYAVISEGVLTINGGTFKSGVDANGAPNAVIYARGKGKVYVNGGTFPNENKSKYVLNKKDADRANTEIKVTGGKFQNFNPGDNAAEGNNTNFLADGYYSYAVDETWFAVEKNK